MLNNDITTSLEWSKKLKEAGWPQEDPIFRWAIQKFGDYHVDPFIDFARIGYCTEGFTASHEDRHEFIVAPTASELWGRIGDATVWKDSEGFHCQKITKSPGGFDQDAQTDGHTAQEVLAAMYCYLSDNKLLPL